MHFRTVPALAVLTALIAMSACSSGGGSSTPLTTPNAIWARFRNDASNTGAASAVLAKDFDTIDKDPLVRFYPPMGSLGPISTAPVIGLDHTIYFTTEVGALYALNQDLTPKWAQPIKGCPGQMFGTIHSSPALTAVRSGLSTTATNDKVLFFGDDTGHLYAVQDQGAEAECKWVFPPSQGTPIPTPGTPLAPIVSSPAFIIDTTTEIISGVFFGTTGGTFYALNGVDGSVKWQFQVPSGAAITSSPALDIGGPIYFTAADGNLYALSLDGTFIFSKAVGTVAASTTSTSSPLRFNLIVVGTDDGNVVGLQSNGDQLWRFTTNGDPPRPIVASLGLGTTTAPLPTPTLGPTNSPLPAGTFTPTPTPTPRGLVRAIIFAIDDGGGVYAIDEHTGQRAEGVSIPSSNVATVSSPAVSIDGCIVFGDSSGALNVIRLEQPYGDQTPTPTPGGQCLTHPPIQLTERGMNIAVRSSPAIDTDGVVYVGADDGRLYVIGTGTD